MDYLLCFSVGAILGDIFFHLIPESFESHLVELAVSAETAHRKVGISMMAGIFMFRIVEMILERWSDREDRNDSIVKAQRKKSEEQHQSKKCKQDLTGASGIDQHEEFLENNNNNTLHCSECLHQASNILDSSTGSPKLDKRKIVTMGESARHRKHHKASEDRCLSPLSEQTTSRKQALNGAGLIAGQVIDPAGYLSLIANGIDNFTHGLAIGASFLVGIKVGLLTTFVIFVHEIPHEICDYAILVNSGFSRWDAVKAQWSVSLFGIMGTATALYFKSIDTLTAKMIWILPFSAGGFLHIALVNLLPEILSRRTNFRDSFEQIGCVILGIAFMGAVALS